MLQLSPSFINIPVMSLRTGGQVATATEPIINPNSLKIEGWWCQDQFSKGKDEPLVLLGQDVRDFIKQGFVVDDHDALTSPNDLVRLKDVLHLNFSLLGKPVYSDTKKKLGKVGDYAVEVETLYIQKFYLTQSFLKGFGSGGLSVDRSQIIEITDRKIVIHDLLKPAKAGRIATAPSAP